MASSIDATKPTAGAALTADVRNNFSAAKTEIEALQAAVASATPTGAVTASGLTMSTGKLLGRTTAGTGAIEEITLGTAAPLNVSTDGTLAANSDTLISTQKAVKTYAEKFVVGPASAVDSRVATFDGVSGKLIKDSGMAVSVVGNAVRLTNTGTTTGVADMFEFEGPGYYGPPVLWRFDNIGQISHSFGSIRFALSGTASTAVTSAGVGLQDSSVLGWAGSNPTGTAELAIARTAADVMSVTDGASGFRDVKLRSLISSGGVITLSNYTVATLPTAASNTHAIVVVTDGNASPTYRGAVTGGGSTKGVVYCDGSSWMWH